MAIGERIIALRKLHNISQNQLAKDLGISRQAVSKWENEQTSPDTLNLIRLAELLDTSVEYLATGTELPLPPSPAEPQIVEKVVEVERIVEVEQIVKVEKRVPVERVIEKVVEKPVYRKITRVKYLRNPLEFLLVATISLVVGFLIGLLF